MPQVIIIIAEGSSLPQCHKHINVAQVKAELAISIISDTIIGTKTKTLKVKHIFEQ